LKQLKEQTPWYGNVWLNPPFNATPAWIHRLIDEWDHINQAMVLINTATGYDWFEMLWRIAPVCCLRKRLCFVDANGIANPKKQAKKGQTIVYIGANEAKFTELWQPYGRVFLP
jgi:hypothetical protein